MSVNTTGGIAGFWIKSDNLVFATKMIETDNCDNNRVVLFYKDGSKHTFKRVRQIQQYRKDNMFRVFGERSINNVYDGDIVEEGIVNYSVDIPRHHVSHYIVHSNDGYGKTERKVKAL